ncbi:hypothetical protein EDB19DRAFT_2038803 [Suillus lakei]|nr:hypothetical protein EDB19DRAFT_2038803 [Suillus lakei]
MSEVKLIHWQHSLCTCQPSLRTPVLFLFQTDVNQASQIGAASGGVLILGGTNSSLYKGSIEYLNITGPPSHWLLAVSSVTVQGKTITIDPPSGLAAIGTGTTLIWAPTPIAAGIWAQVPDSTSQPKIDKAYMHSVIHISVGGTEDMNLGILNDTMIGNANTTSQMSAGCIFDIGISSTPAWIVSDTPEECVPRLPC